MNQDPYKKYSKHLSYVLRHRPDAIGIELDEQGWVDVDDLIEKSPKGLSRELIQKVVATNAKQRFILSEDGLRIRANQGHSVKVDLGLEALMPPAQLYHGTADRFMPAILAGGLKPMNRHHVHLSEDLDTASKVGARHGRLVILNVDSRAMVEAGHRFYRSANGVWLTDAVPPRYLSRG